MAQCLEYVVANINEILRMPIDLNCLNSQLIDQLGQSTPVSCSRAQECNGCGGLSSSLPSGPAELSRSSAVWARGPTGWAAASLLRRFAWAAASLLDVDAVDAIVDRKDKLQSKLYKKKLEALLVEEALPSPSPSPPALLCLAVRLPVQHTIAVHSNATARVFGLKPVKPGESSAALNHSEYCRVLHFVCSCAAQAVVHYRLHHRRCIGCIGCVAGAAAAAVHVLRPALHGRAGPVDGTYCGVL